MNNDYKDVHSLPTGYAPQAEYHAEMAKSIMLHGAHVSESVQEKADIYRVLISMYYTCLLYTSDAADER